MAAPLAFAAGVYVSVPADETAGATENNNGLVLPVTPNVSV